MKDIIITAGGKNITPSELENELKFSPYITDAVVIGDKRPYLVAIIMIDQDNVEKFAQDREIPFSNYASLTRAPEVQELVQAEMDRVNAKFARVEQIKKFFLLDRQLSAEDEELTPTMKLKRKLVEKKYADQIDTIVAMLACHASQVFEWLAYEQGILETLPADQAGRIAWLKAWYTNYIRPRAAHFREEVSRAFGDAGSSLEFVEAFEISEYALRPDAALLLQLFPSCRATRV
jgi:hypothetical protein